VYQTDVYQPPGTVNQAAKCYYI